MFLKKCAVSILTVSMLITSIFAFTGIGMQVSADDNTPLTDKEIADLIDNEFMNHFDSDVTTIDPQNPTYSKARYRFYDSTDPDNLRLLYQSETLYGPYLNLQDLWYESISENGYIRIPGMYFDRAASYDNPSGSSDGVMIYNLYYYSYDADKEWLRLKIHKTDKAYKVSGIADGNGFYVFNSVFYLDDEVVWCIEPDVETYEGVNYEKKHSEDNLLATMASIYGYGYKGDKSAIAAMATQIQVWSSVGYEDLFENAEFPFDDAEQSKYDEIKDRILTAYRLYKDESSLKLAPVSKNVLIKDGVITLDGKDGVQTVVLSTENKELLQFYNDIGIAYPTGITGEIDLDNGTVTLTIDKSKYKGDKIVFSLIPPEFERETILYKPLSIRQKLMSFGMLNHRNETLEVEFKTGDIPDNSKEEPSAEDKSKPNTGDQTQLVIYLAVGIVALVAVTGVAYARRKNKKQ